MADDKDDFDSDKTMIDTSYGRSKPSDQGTEDSTTLLPPADEDRTMVAPRQREAPPQDDSDRTMVRGSVPRPADEASSAPQELVGLSGPARGKRFPIGTGETLIGSAPSCQVVIPGSQPVHAKVVATATGHQIHNLGDPGSVVLSGGRRAEGTALKSGDLIRIGPSVLRFVAVGDVFSSEFSEAELASSGLSGLLGSASPGQRRMWMIGGGLVVVLLLLFLWPTGEPAKQTAAPSDTTRADEREREIASLLASGEVLFQAGKLMTPPDQPEADSAFSKFNEVLSRDPGNEQALAWLKKIDEERERQRTAREEAERRRREAEQARLQRQRDELEARVAAILAEGDALFNKGQVTEPAGSNALARYRAALEVYPESDKAKERIERAVQHHVRIGDERRDAGDSWAALESYRKAARVTDGKDENVQARIRETEANLRSGMVGAGSALVMYKDEKGRLFVLDELDKVPARYRDRAVEIKPDATPKEGGGVRRTR